VLFLKKARAYEMPGARQTQHGACFLTMPRKITRAPQNLKVACFLLVKRMPIYKGRVPVK
jgi:hypothetical protein